MGKRHRAAAASTAYEVGRSEIREGEERRSLTEQRLGIEEGLLGTPEQVGGALGGPSAAELPYSQRYGVDEALVGQLAGGRYAFGGAAYVPQTEFSRFFETVGGAPAVGARGGLPAYVGDLSSRANTLMEQAQAAAKEGRLDEAESLRLQAEGVFSGISPNLREAFWLQEDPGQAARAQLSSPMARGVGALVQQGRELLDPESATSRRFLSTLTQPGERAIAAGSRQTERAIRDLSLRSGAARQPGAELAARERVGEGEARQRADNLSRAQQFFEGFSREFATNTFGFAQAWLQNQSGIRETFQGQMDQLRLQLSTASLAQGAALQGQAFQMETADKEWRRQLIAAIAGAVIQAGGMAAGGAASRPPGSPPAGVGDGGHGYQGIGPTLAGPPTG